MRRVLCAVLSGLLAACANDLPTSPELEVSYARGPKPGSGTQITATRLDSKQLGCSSSRASAINDATVSTAVGYCGRNGQTNLLLWNEADGGSVINVPQVLFTDVSISGTVYGTANFQAFVRPAGGAVTYLPVFGGASWSSVRGAAANDTRAVGDVEVSTGPSSSVKYGALWTNTGGTWSVEEFPGLGRALTPDGQMIVGTTGHATAWTNSGGTWVAQSLPDGGAQSSRANAVNQDGTVIAGVRYIPLVSDPTTFHDEHVAWIADGAGGWTMKILGGLNIREGEAYGVANQIDGSIVVVGESWDDTAGRGGQLWAVAWKKPAGSSEFDAPIRLSPLSSGFTAGANDINSRGQIVGYSYSRSSAYAVLWQLR